MFSWFSRHFFQFGTDLDLTIHQGKNLLVTGKTGKQFCANGNAEHRRVIDGGRLTAGD